MSAPQIPEETSSDSSAVPTVRDALALRELRREEFWSGVREVAPSLLGIATWGLVTGVAMVKTGLTVAQAVGMTLLVFAGSAQLASLPLIVAGVPVWLVLVTATIINLRFVIYAAVISPWFRDLSVRWRLMFGYLTSDIGFVLFSQRAQNEPERLADPERRYWNFIGMACANWLAWQILSLAGIFLASQIPTQWGLEFAGTLALIALTIPFMNNLPGISGIVAAAVVAAVGAHWPLRLGLLAAVVSGIVVATLVENIQAERHRKASTSQNSGGAA